MTGLQTYTHVMRCEELTALLKWDDVRVKMLKDWAALAFTDAKGDRVELPALAVAYQSTVNAKEAVTERSMSEAITPAVAARPAPAAAGALRQWGHGAPRWTTSSRSF